MLIKIKIDIIASGGIRNPLDVVKCLALGAKAVGVSKIFLEILVNEGKDALIQEIEKWKKEVKFLMILMNARNIAELDKKNKKNRILKNKIPSVWMESYFNLYWK